ncbi:MAG: ATP-dependent sacrificial sulfur transferase LarE [Candidatus Dormiibacterota bacterium]
MRYELAQRLEAMGRRIGALEGALVAYSGGVDSTLVLAVAHQVLGDACLGVIARSPSLPATELEAALAVAGERGIPVRVLATNELEVEGYVRNQPDRCFFCKTELYGALAELADDLGGRAVLDGFNVDDRGDWRPGRQAAADHGVISPLDDAGLGKEDIREAARELGLANWDKPAAACLASRIAYGEPVTVATLSKVEAAELLLRGEGFGQLRVRHHGDTARIEVEADQVPRLLEPDRLARVEAGLRRLGYASVSVDPHGYRRGSLNATT